MSYSQPLINQPRVLFLSIGLGVLLSVIYVLIQGVLRLLGEGRLSYYLADAIFVVTVTLVSFFLLVLYNEGRVRRHLIVGKGAGFFFFYYSVGRYIYTALAKLCTAARILLKPYAFVFNSFKRGMSALFRSVSGKISLLRKKGSPEAETEQKIRKKFNLFGKIHLKNQDKSV